MTSRGLMLFLFSVVGGIAGSFVASLISFWLYPLLRSDISMFLRDLFSAGAIVSAGLVWLFYSPALLVLLFASMSFVKIRPREWTNRFLFAVSFLLVCFSQMHPFVALGNGVVEYLLNTMFVGLILMGALTVMRPRRD